jgi:type III restriction enzyme
MAVIDDVYRRAARFISPDIARTYTEAIALRKANPDIDDEFEEALTEARTDIAALGLVAEVQPYFDAEADKLAKAWLDEYRVAIKGLPHDRQEAYREIRAMSREAQDIELLRPQSRLEPTSLRQGETVTPLPTYEGHLLCDDKGRYPALLNTWEDRVLSTERQRPGFTFWYRNPQQPGQSSLGIAYLNNGQYKTIRPDFIFFGTHDGKVVADIVDPHGIHLGDACRSCRDSRSTPRPTLSITGALNPLQRSAVSCGC